MNKAAAWIMKLNDSSYASISQMELVHIINDPVFIRVPKSPGHCENIIIWNDNVLPVVDLDRFYDAPVSKLQHNVVAVIIFRDNNNDLHHGGIALNSSPVLEYVNNSQSCTIPNHAKPLKDITLACFTSEQGHQVPILDMTKLFSRAYSKALIDQEICSE
jgi:chemotaxis signal transduction protein